MDPCKPFSTLECIAKHRRQYLTKLQIGFRFFYLLLPLRNYIELCLLVKPNPIL